MYIGLHVACAELGMTEICNQFLHLAKTDGLVRSTAQCDFSNTAVNNVRRRHFNHRLGKVV